MLLPIIWVLVFFASIALKAFIKGELENKDWREVALSTLMSVFLIVGSTLLLAQPTIIGRAFENTVGYWWINGESLTEATKSVFTSNAEYNYNVIATQLFSDNFDEYLGKMTAENGLNPFKGVVANIGSAEPLRKLVATKYNVSKGVIASLATIISLYTSNMQMY